MRSEMWYSTWTFQIDDLESHIHDLERGHQTLVRRHGELEEAYDRQEAMLAQSTLRVQELEDAQGQLQNQVSAFPGRVSGMVHP